MLVIGYSERTEKTTIERLAEALKREGSRVRKILVVAIPPQRATMHLDTVFTRISAGECLCYGPMILSGGAEEADVYEADLTAREITWTTRDDLLSALAALGIDLVPILCGGADPIDQQREQWTDGANVFALAPGVILCYDRNERTAESLAREGYAVVADDDLLLGTGDARPEEARQARDPALGARAVPRARRPALHDDAARARSGVKGKAMLQKDLVSIHDLTAADVAALFALAARMKARPAEFRTALSGKILAMIFEKSSTRTRVSFEAGMTQLGGAAQFLSSRDIQLGRGEPIADTARVLSRYVNGIMARTFAHETVLELARHATIPVINGLTDLLHPCQALTDYFTMSEKFGKLASLKLAYVGDGNNMAHSLMYGGPKCSVHVAIATPKGYEPDATVTANARADAAAAGTTLLLTHSKEEAVQGAHVVYTDVWASMGQEAEQQKRVRDFAGWTVTNELLARAHPDAVFMHCLPAHRGEEVAAEVCDGPRSVIFDEAENRLHVQKAILATLMGRL